MSTQGSASDPSAARFGRNRCCVQMLCNSMPLLFAKGGRCWEEGSLLTCFCMAANWEPSKQAAVPVGTEIWEMSVMESGLCSSGGLFPPSAHPVMLGALSVFSPALKCMCTSTKSAQQGAVRQCPIPCALPLKLWGNLLAPPVGWGGLSLGVGEGWGWHGVY